MVGMKIFIINIQTRWELMSKKIRSIRIDDKLWEEIEKASKNLSISKASLITIAIVEKLNRIQGQN